MYAMVANFSDNGKDKIAIQVVSNDENYTPFDTWKIFPPCEDIKRWKNTKKSNFTKFSKTL